MGLLYSTEPSILGHSPGRALSQDLCPAGTSCQSLSYTCRALFAFININVPFRDVNVVGGNVSGLRSLRRHARVLSFAAKVQWSPGERNKPWRRLWYSTRPWTVVGQAFHFILLVLQTSTSLRTLQLVYVELKSSHQLVMLTIAALKSLVLDNSYFVPTAIEMPRLSITSLRLTHGSRRVPVEYTLEFLRNTLETLEVGIVSVDIPLILETMRLPRLTCLTHRGIRSGFIPRASSTITNHTSQCAPVHFLWLSPTVYFPSYANFSHRGGSVSDLPWEARTSLP